MADKKHRRKKADARENKNLHRQRGCIDLISEAIQFWEIGWCIKFLL